MKLLKSLGIVLLMAVVAYVGFTVVRLNLSGAFGPAIYCEAHVFDPDPPSCLLTNWVFPEVIQ